MAEEADDYQDIDQEIDGLVRPTDGLLARHNLISREDLMQNSLRASVPHRSVSPVREVEGTLLSQDLLDEEVDQPMRPDVDFQQFAYNKKL